MLFLSIVRLDLVTNTGDKLVGGMLVLIWAPRNVALLFFNPSPDRFFRGAQTEIAIYSHDDDVIDTHFYYILSQIITNIISCKMLRSCPRKKGQGKLGTFADFSNFFSESQPLYPVNKYHIYLDQFNFFNFLQFGFEGDLKTA